MHLLKTFARLCLILYTAGCRQVSSAIQPGFVARQDISIVATRDQNLTILQRRQHRVVIIVVQCTGRDETSALCIEDFDLPVPAADQDISIRQQNCGLCEFEPFLVHIGNLAKAPCLDVIDFGALIFAVLILLIRPAQDEDFH